jgi:uncharacterized protein (TIGR02118 family)
VFWRSLPTSTTTEPRPSGRPYRGQRSVSAAPSGTRALRAPGRPTEPDAFDEYYRNVHAPLAHKIPGLIRFEAGHAAPLGGDEALYLVATLDFDSAEAFTAGLQSPEGSATLADVQNFATGGVSISHYDIEPTTG